MIRKTKAARLLDTSRTTTTKKQTTFVLTARRVFKALIVTAALLGWLPYAAADWLVRHGGLTHD